DSAVFLREALKRVHNAGYGVANLDASLILAAPKIGPHAAAIRARIAQWLGVDSDCVGLKAKTPEGLNLENTAVAHVVVLLEARRKPKKPRMKNSARVFVIIHGAFGMPLHRQHEVIGIRAFQRFDDAIVRATSYDAQAFPDHIR